MSSASRQLSSRLKHRISLEAPQTVADEAGGFSTSWQKVAPLWAEIMPLSGEEQFRSQQLQATITHRITLRFREEVDASMRVHYEGRIFNIRSVINPQEENAALVLLAEEGSAT